MIRLCIDSSAKAASVALLQDDRLLSEQFLNVGLTHSETLLPMVSSVLSAAKLQLGAVDCYAVTHGPGSFTGIRIGIAAVKGMALANGSPCVGVSTLEAMAWNLAGQDCIAVCTMDARCAQVYTALFRCARQGVTRLCADDALPITALAEKLEAYQGEPLVLLGDGAQLCFDALAQTALDIRLAPEHLRYQRAAGAGFASLQSDESVSAADLTPVYLRLPQAERELKKRTENQE